MVAAWLPLRRGSWKKCYAQNKTHRSAVDSDRCADVKPSRRLMGSVLTVQPTYWLVTFGRRLGRLRHQVFRRLPGWSAAGARALAETGKGFVNCDRTGYVETIAIFVLAFAMMFMGNAGILK